MPMFIWLPAIVVSGWWSALAAEAGRQVARQSGANWQRHQDQLEEIEEGS
jgi:hypothetical protein